MIVLYAGVLPLCYGRWPMLRTWRPHLGRPCLHCALPCRPTGFCWWWRGQLRAAAQCASAHALSAELHSVLLLRARRAILRDEPTQLSHSIRFIYRDYRPALYCWELVEMAKKEVCSHAGLLGCSLTHTPAD